jgi:hypothetical protein
LAKPKEYSTATQLQTAHRLPVETGRIYM